MQMAHDFGIRMVRSRGWASTQAVLVHLCAAAFVSLAPAPSTAQIPVASPDTIIVPGPHYAAGWFHRLIFGDHYRDLWTRPTTVSFLDFDRVGGGLTPLCVGGGFQTKSLRFEAADGRQFVFRSVDKDPTAKLDSVFRGTFVADALQDQISSHHPAGAVVVAPLLDAAGVLHAEPQIRLMPPDDRLGQFRDEFAGVLGLLEERPRDGFAGFDRIEGTDHVWEAIEDSPRDRVDAEAFLVARLMDVFLGDWDRHQDQWRWARYPDGDGNRWLPIPRDRDQAFARLDGLVLSLARPYVRELTSFAVRYPSMFGLTWTGRALDRRFLAELDAAAWDSIARSLQSRLTDAVITEAVAAMPVELQPGHADWLRTALRSRRDELPGAARAFYDLLAEYVDIHGTDRGERAEVTRRDDGRVDVTVFAMDDGEARRARPLFHRVFHPDETREIRLYLHGGRDAAVVRGVADRSILVRIVGGGGGDVLTDSSRVGDGAAPTRFYDDRGDNMLGSAQRTVTDRRRFRRAAREVVPAARRPDACGESIPDPPPRSLSEPFRDWGTDWFPVPAVTVDPDLGLYAGFGGRRFDYGFRQEPYENHLEVSGGVATGPRRVRFRFIMDTRDVAGRFGASVDVRYSGIDVLRYHGLGNETVVTLPPDFYKLTQRQVSTEAGLTTYLSANAHLIVGAFFRLTHTRLGRGNSIDSLRPYGSEPFKQVGLQASVELDTRDRAIAASRGVWLTARAVGVPDFLDAVSSYGYVSGRVATFFSPGLPLDPTLALQAGGTKIWGRFPFFDAAFLGGASSLRGFSEQRFAGDAAVHGNAELRLRLLRHRVLLPGEFGVFGLADVGRVFVSGERSDDWHAAGGGGIWFSLIDRTSTMSVAVAQSGERRALYAGLGFMM